MGATAALPPRSAGAAPAPRMGVVGDAERGHTVVGAAPPLLLRTLCVGDCARVSPLCGGEP